MSMEKRRFPRLYYHYLANYHILDETMAREGICVTENLSLGGIMVELQEEMPMGTILELTIALKDCIITAQAKIVHVQATTNQSFDIGMEFTDISEHDSTRLGQFLSRL